MAGTDSLSSGIPLLEMAYRSTTRTITTQMPLALCDVDELKPCRYHHETADWTNILSARICHIPVKNQLTAFVWYLQSEAHCGYVRQESVTLHHFVSHVRKVAARWPSELLSRRRTPRGRQDLMLAWITPLSHGTKMSQHAVRRELCREAFK